MPICSWLAAKWSMIAKASCPSTLACKKQWTSRIKEWYCWIRVGHLQTCWISLIRPLSMPSASKCIRRSSQVMRKTNAWGMKTVAQSSSWTNFSSASLSCSTMVITWRPKPTSLQIASPKWKKLSKITDWLCQLKRACGPNSSKVWQRTCLNWMTKLGIWSAGRCNSRPS